MKFYPTMYKKSIHDISYDKLKRLGVKCLMFDLDKTLVENRQKNLEKKERDFLRKLKKEFIVVIVSNNKSKKRVKRIADDVGCLYFYLSMKPLTRILKKIQKIYNLDKKEMCMIGDQLPTDIWVANRFGCYSCYVDPFTRKNIKKYHIRVIEKLILKQYEKKKIMKRGSYYE